MSDDYSSVDRLGADVGPEYFRCVTYRRPNARCLEQRFISAGLSGLVGETRLRQLGLTTKKGENICPLEENVRRLTSEIVEKISRDIVDRHYVTLYANTERPREA